jgi:hypothetical protein
MYFWTVSRAPRRFGAEESAYGLVTGISALGSKRLLVHQEKLFVRGKQVDSVVQHWRVCYVIRDEIVISAQGSWILGLRCLRGQLHQALHGSDVFLPLRDGKVAPADHVSIGEGSRRRCIDGRRTTPSARQRFPTCSCCSFPLPSSSPSTPRPWTLRHLSAYRPRRVDSSRCETWIYFSLSAQESVDRQARMGHALEFLISVQQELFLPPLQPQ